MSRSAFTTPARVETVVYRTLPSDVEASEEPLVHVFGELRIDLDLTRGEHDPVYFKAQVQVFADGTFDVIDMVPLFGTLSGQAKAILDIYKEVLEDALLRSGEQLLGVR